MSRSALIIGGILLSLIAIPWVFDLTPNAIDLMNVLQPPSSEHLLGTDENGRDVLHRIVSGAQLTLGIGVASALLSLIVGSLLGATAGSLGGVVDDVIMRTTDLALALPTLFVILVFSSIVNPGILQLILLIGLTGWMSVARVIRGTAREISARQFVLAAHSFGASQLRIVLRHILPNLRSVVLVTATLQLGRAILTEATISFLGVGVQPPEATWGSMLSGAQSYLLIAPWLALAPGISLTVVLVMIANLTLDDRVQR